MQQQAIGCSELWLFCAEKSEPTNPIAAYMKQRKEDAQILAAIKNYRFQSFGKGQRLSTPAEIKKALAKETGLTVRSVRIEQVAARNRLIMPAPKDDER